MYQECYHEIFFWQPESTSYGMWSLSLYCLFMSTSPIFGSHARGPLQMYMALLHVKNFTVEI